jgi:hypothetical protein
MVATVLFAAAAIMEDLMRRIRRSHAQVECGPPDLAGSADVALRWFYRYEVEHLLARAGFSELTFWGSFDRQPWKAEGETVVRARAPA